jgi:serine/threonine protein kinase
MSKRTNIYQVGLIMASAMRRLNPLPETNWRDPLPSINYAIPPANQLHHDGLVAPRVGVHELTRAQLNPGPKKYSDALVSLVEHCLRHNNANRPSAATLLQNITLNADFQGMDTATRMSLTAAQRKLCIDLDDERYAINSIFQ